MEITLYVNGSETGPHSLEEVQGMIANGKLTKGDYAYFEGCADWVTVADIPGIDEVVAEAEPEPQVAEEEADPAADAGGEATIYIWPDGAEDWDGPYGIAQIQEMVAGGQITTADYASGFEGCAEGSTVADIPGLEEAAEEPVAEEEPEEVPEEEPVVEEAAEEEAVEEEAAPAPGPGIKRSQFQQHSGGKAGFAKKAGLGMKKAVGGGDAPPVGGGMAKKGLGGGMAKKGGMGGGMVKKGGFAQKGAAPEADEAGSGVAAKSAAKGAAKKVAANKAATPAAELSDGELSETSFTMTYILACFLGWAGVHRFVNGKALSGVLMLLTGGGCFIWLLIDIIMILLGKFKDKQGRVVAMAPQEGMSDKKLGTILLIMHFVPIPGIHRFLTGKVVLGIVQLITFGGLGIWILIDWIKLAQGKFTDKEGRPILATV